MRPWPFMGCLVLLLLLLQTVQGFAVDLKNRSTSRSRQFIVYCDDRQARSRVASVAEDMKADLLGLLDEEDHYRFPIVICIEPSPQGKVVTPVQLHLVNTIAGPKIDLLVHVGDDPGRIFLQRHIFRSLLIEMAYRDLPPPKPGSPIAEPPWWLVEGLIQTVRRRENGTEPEIFKSIANTDKLPSIEKILQQPPLMLDTAAGTVDQACALCLVEALLAFPKGPASLGKFIRALPASGGDTLAALLREFPALEGSHQKLSKWWALQLERFANNDRWQGMGLEESDRELSTLLQLEVVVDKTGRKQKFAFADFETYRKAPGARVALQTVQVKFITLSTKAHALYRAILAEYEQIAGLLSAGKTRGISTRIDAIETYRRTVLKRMSQIHDYLNWYEATQAPPPPDLFRPYLQRIEDAAKPPPFDPRISEYLDALEAEFAPLQPNMIPGSGTADNTQR